MKLAKTISTNANDGVFNSINSLDNIFNKKWNVPMPRPPVCLSDDPIKIKQNDNFTSLYSAYG